MTDPKDKTEEKAPEKPLPVNKETVKDLSVQPEKEGDVVWCGCGWTESERGGGTWELLDAGAIHVDTPTPGVPCPG